MMTATITRYVTLEDTTCNNCSIVFAVPEDWLANRRTDGATFYCPNGHSLVFRKTEVQKLREQLQRAEARATHAEDQRAAAERSRAALAGQVTKIRKRVGNGVCPCCNRSFANVHRHMRTQHPDYSEPS